MLEFAERLQSTRLSVTIQSVEWVVPLVQSVHILMIGIVLVAVLMLALRVLGQVRTDQPIEQVWRRFAPWMWTGLGALAATGLVLIVGEPVREATALSFWLKMALIVVAVAVTVTFARSLPPARGSALPALTAQNKVVAVATLLLWLAIIFLGRAIAYDAAVWGAWSPSS